MDSNNVPTPLRAREDDIAAATAHLKESWEHGKDAASDARQITGEIFRDLVRNVEQAIESRPGKATLWALGAGALAGFLAGLLVSRAARAPSSTAA